MISVRTVPLARVLRGLALGVTLWVVGGCGVVSAVSDAAEQLDAFTLAPLPVAKRERATTRHLVVELPAAGGALATDRILIKPNRLQAQYLPGGRWVDAAPVLMQSLLVASLQNNGGFRLVGRDSAGLTPDYILLTDLHDFQAETVTEGGPSTLVRVGVTLTIVRDADRSLIASRRFEQTATANGDETLAIVSAFDAAVSRILTDAVAWSAAEAH